MEQSLAATVQKAVDLTTPAKKRRKMNIIAQSDFSDQKVHDTGLYAGFEICLQNHLHKA